MSAPLHPSTFVKCPGCGAKLPVRADLAGRRGQCHECGKIFLIRPRHAEAAAETTPAAVGGAAPASPPPPPPPTAGPSHSPAVFDNAHLHPVVCEVCQMLVYATDDQVGTMLKCPDCGHRNLATRRLQKPVRQVMVPDGEEYELDVSDAPPPTPMFLPIEVREAQFRAAARARLGLQEEGDESAPSRTEPANQTGPARKGREESAMRGSTSSDAQRTRRDPQRPLVPVVQGVMRMLLSGEVTIRWAALSLVMTWVLFLMYMVLGAMGNQALFIMPLFAGGCMLAGIWLMSAAPLFMAVTTQSTDGNDELYDPPSWIALDFAEAAFLLLAAAVSALPAWLAMKGASGLPEEGQWSIGAGVWLLVFPFVVLSALEQGSPLAIFSPRLAGSLVRCFVPWLAFYIASTAVIAGVGWLALYLASRGSLIAMAPIPWLAVGLIFVYMRMLGRLGWWIADVMPPPAEAKEE